METPKTKKDYIKDAILKARQFHFDGNTPSDEDVEKLENELYDNLLDFSPNKCVNVSTNTEKENPLKRPSAYSLIDIFKELKFGRPAADQKYLAKCITELEQGQD